MDIEGNWYREKLIAKIKELEAEVDELKLNDSAKDDKCLEFERENQRLREALEEIATLKSCSINARIIAQKALEK